MQCTCLSDGTVGKLYAVCYKHHETWKEVLPRTFLCTIIGMYCAGVMKLIILNYCKGNMLLCSNGTFILKLLKSWFIVFSGA